MSPTETNKLRGAAEQNQGTFPWILGCAYRLGAHTSSSFVSHVGSCVSLATYTFASQRLLSQEQNPTRRHTARTGKKNLRSEKTRKETNETFGDGKKFAIQESSACGFFFVRVCVPYVCCYTFEECARKESTCGRTFRLPEAHRARQS